MSHFRISENVSSVITDIRGCHECTIILDHEMKLEVMPESSVLTSRIAAAAAHSKAFNHMSWPSSTNRDGLSCHRATREHRHRATNGTLIDCEMRFKAHERFFITI